jgi:hypothetical protein
VALNEAIAGDPWNAGLRRNLAGYLLEAGAEDAARAEVETVHRLTPRSRIVLRVNIGEKPD